MYNDQQKERFLNELRDRNFNISRACKAAKVHRSTYYEWLKDPEFSERVNDMMEEDLDNAEEMQRYLRLGIPKIEIIEGKRVVTGWHKEPDRQALHFFLATKGKKRGWQVNQELNPNSHNQGQIVIVRIPDNNRGRPGLSAGESGEPSADE